VAIAVVACAVVAVALSRGGSDSPEGLSATYRMTFDNLTYDIQTDGTLTEVTQDENGNISGLMTVGPGLYGTGRFTGTVADDTIDFLGVSNGVYSGTISSEGLIRGTYTYASQRGEWTATPTATQASAAGGGLPWWLWLVVVMLVIAVIGYPIVRRLRQTSTVS
jgi:hypothetical protein